MTSKGSRYLVMNRKPSCSMLLSVGCRMACVFWFADIQFGVVASQSVMAKLNSRKKPRTTIKDCQLGRVNKRDELSCIDANNSLLDSIKAKIIRIRTPPTYTMICVMATKSASAKMNKPAIPNNTKKNRKRAFAVFLRLTTANAEPMVKIANT